MCVVSWSMRLTLRTHPHCLSICLSYAQKTRACSLVCVFHGYSTATNRVINASDHASIQLNIGHVDASGVYTGQYTTMSICGFLRQMVREYKRTREQIFPYVHSRSVHEYLCFCVCAGEDCACVADVVVALHASSVSVRRLCVSSCVCVYRARRTVPLTTCGKRRSLPSARPERILKLVSERTT